MERRRGGGGRGCGLSLGEKRHENKKTDANSPWRAPRGHSKRERTFGRCPGVAAASAGQPDHRYCPGEAGNHGGNRVAAGTLLRYLGSVLDESANQIRSGYRRRRGGPEDCQRSDASGLKSEREQGYGVRIIWWRGAWGRGSRACALTLSTDRTSARLRVVRPRCGPICPHALP